MDEDAAEAAAAADCNDTTSPSQLQEVTLDPDATFANSMASRSPRGLMRGRSVRDYEDQLTNLKKENFNLKLRIYFLEERMGTNFNLDKESAIKKNIELKVEVESLRKEVEEKQDLLCQAVKAMELEEEEHKKETVLKEQQLSDYQERIDDLQQKLQYLSSENDKLQKGDSANFHFFSLPEELESSDIVKQIRNRIEELQCELSREKERSAAMENLLHMSDCNGIRYKSLEEELRQKDQQIVGLQHELREIVQKCSNYNSHMQTLENELMQRNSDLQLKSKELQAMQQHVKNQQIELDQVKKMLSQSQLLCETEQKKGEKLKAAIMARNSKVIELESLGEAQKAKIRNLESRLESSQIEVKRKSDELEALKSPVQRPKVSNTDDSSFSVQNSSAVSGSSDDKKSQSKVSVKLHSPSVSSTRLSSIENSEKINANSSGGGEILHAPSAADLIPESNKFREEMTTLQQKNQKLKSEQYKACQIIKTMINTRGENEKEIETLKNHIEQLEQEISSMTDLMKEKKCAKLDENVIAKGNKLMQTTKPSELNFGAVVNPLAETEILMAKNREDERTPTEYYKQLITYLEDQTKLLAKTIEEKDSLIRQFKVKLEDASEHVKAKDDRIVDLEFELIATAQTDLKNLSEMEKPDGKEKDTSLWIALLEDKDRDIERLENELRKRTCDLQGVVNKELWEKNREIEKLQNRFGSVIENKEKEMVRLEKEVSEKSMQLTILKEKISELGIQVNLPSALMTASEIKINSSVCDETKSVQEQLKLCLEERKYCQQEIEELRQKLKNTPEREVNKQIEQLKTECTDLREELQKSEKLRHECTEVCKVLSTRLEELARYLNTLLKQKIVLGFLGSRHNSKLQKIVDQSLDLSRTLNVTSFLDPDQSLTQLTNISNLLDISKYESLNELLESEESNSILSLVPEDVTLTYKNHLYNKKDVEKQDVEKDHIIAVLRQQVENLKREIEVRDNEFEEFSTPKKTHDRISQKSFSKSEEKVKLSRTSATEKIHSRSLVDNNSESESWSEPDRSVSLARIGLDDECLKPQSMSKRKLYDISTESTEEEFSHTSRNSGKKNSTDNRQIIILLDEKVKMLESKLKEGETKLAEEILCKQVYEKQLDKLQKNIQELENKLTCCEDSKREAENKIEELCKVINNLEDVKQALSRKMESKDKLTQNKINLLEIEKEEALKTAEKVAEIAEATKEAMKLGETRIKELEEAEKKYKNKIKTAEQEIKDLKFSLVQLQEIYERDYVKKCEIDRKMLEVQNIREELEDLRSLLKTAEHKIHVMEENELDLKYKLHNLEKEHHDKINVLRKELDIATLQYSETVLEKTRITNEKVSLEQQLTKLDFKESELLKQVGDFQEEFNSLKQVFQMQVANVENQKSKLEVKVSELESKNAELKNRLIKIQSGDQPVLHSTSLPNSPTRYCDLYGKNISFHQQMPLPLYKRQYSDNSGYTSEDQVVEDPNRAVGNINAHAHMLPNMIPIDVQRHHENSSPDLGIESDHGRFSSLEANMNVPRPLLQTLELTESMNNLLDAGDKEFIQQAFSCNDENCCEKAKQMANENIDLKKRLLRTRRALEETVTQLTIANQRKKQVEKTICRQIHKTSQVLRKAKANLDSGSESEIRKN